jgi:transposase
MAGQDPAKIKMAELMLNRVNWQEAARVAGVLTSQTSAYRFLTTYCLRGENALEERRGGHAHKLVGDGLVWLVAECQAKPEITARELREAIDKRFGVRVSRGHLNAVRRARGLSRPKKKRA